MALLVEHLGGQVVRSSTDRLPSVSCRLQLGSQTKVPDLQLHRLAHKEVTCRGKKEEQWRSALDIQPRMKGLTRRRLFKEKKRYERFLTEFQVSVKDLLLVQVPQTGHNLS